MYVYQRHEYPVVVFEREWSYLSSCGSSVFTEPHGVNIIDDVVYVTDRSDHPALKFTLEGGLLLVIRNRGVHSDAVWESPRSLMPTSAGLFNFPTDLTPSLSGYLYVSDGYRNPRVHKFNPQGEVLSSGEEVGGEHHGSV